MILRTRMALAMLACAALAACETPRGAGFRSEVLAATVDATADTPAQYDFVVEPVTRSSLPVVQRWPRTGGRSYNWLKRNAQPATSTIAAGDVLSITIWDAEENSLLTAPGQRVAQLQDIKVSADGRVFLPFVGKLKVSGLSPDAARARVEARLTDTVPSAQVQLSVAQGRANTANLVAGVGAPGVYPLPDRDYSLLALLSQGGGVIPSLNNPQVRLMRGGKIYGKSVARLYENPAFDTRLRGGDRVIVEADDRYFLSLGATGSEARHLFPQDHVTALDALAVIGGVSDTRANPQGVLILRTYPQSALRGDRSGPRMDRVVFTLDLTSADGLFSAGIFHIMPGDLVYATESPVNAASTVLGLLGTVLGVAGAL